MSFSKFNLRPHGFSEFDCSSFLCVFAPLREHNPFCQRISRKGAKPQSFPELRAIAAQAISSRNHFFDLLLWNAKTLSEHPLTRRKIRPA